MRFHYRLTISIGCKINFEYFGSENKKKINLDYIILLYFLHDITLILNYCLALSKWFLLQAICKHISFKQFKQNAYNKI